MILSKIREGQRFVMLDYRGNKLDCWQVLHSVEMPSGRLRVTIFDVDAPADIIDIYADALLDATRFIPMDYEAGNLPRLDGRMAA